MGMMEGFIDRFESYEGVEYSLYRERPSGNACVRISDETGEKVITYPDIERAALAFQDFWLFDLLNKAIVGHLQFPTVETRYPTVETSFP
jgi:hypothetical protein